MRLRFLIALALALVSFVACQGITPTLVVMEVTREVPVTVVVTLAPTETVTPTVSASTTPTETVIPHTATPTPTPTPDLFPTPAVGRIFVAEQVFEFGRMFWIEPVNQIWVLITDSTGKPSWQVFEDTFREGMIERDPALVPPTGLFQPERGFGKLWRERPELRNALGWALSPEVGYNTRYEYHAGGSFNAEGQFVQSSGYHVIEDLERRSFRFIEGTWTWEVTSRP
jgi:hypothetical protein